jgi:hypothetical protein
MTTKIEDAVRVLQAFLPTNLCLDNTNVPDSTVIPLTSTMGELRRLRDAIAAWNRRTPPLDALRALEQKWREASLDCEDIGDGKASAIYQHNATQLAATIKAMGG